MRGAPYFAARSTALTRRFAPDKIGAPTLRIMSTLEMIFVSRFVQGIGGAMTIAVGRLLLLRLVANQDMVSAMSWSPVPAFIGPISTLALTEAAPPEMRFDISLPAELDDDASGDCCSSRYRAPTMTRARISTRPATPLRAVDVTGAIGRPLATHRNLAPYF